MDDLEAEVERLLGMYHAERERAERAEADLATTRLMLERAREVLDEHGLLWPSSGGRQMNFKNAEEALDWMNQQYKETLSRAERAEAEVERLHSWAGLMSLLDENYPADIVDGSSGDPGPRTVVLARAVDAERALADELAEALREALDYVPDYFKQKWPEMQEALAKWEAARQPLRCENCGKTMAEHGPLANCWA